MNTTATRTDDVMTSSICILRKEHSSVCSMISAQTSGVRSKRAGVQAWLACSPGRRHKRGCSVLATQQQAFFSLPHRQLLALQASSPSPVFGLASTFGAGTGFGGFKGVTAASSTPAKAADKEQGVDDTPPEEGTGETEEECSAEFRPLVQLEEVERVSGEEGEKTLIDLCAPYIACLGVPWWCRQQLAPAAHCKIIGGILKCELPIQHR